MNRIICIIFFVCALLNLAKGQIQGNISDRGIDPIGLSKHVRHLRGDIDSAIVTTKYGGWLIDSVKIFENHYKNYRKPYPHQMFYLSKRDKKRIAKCKPFAGTFRWLTIKSKNRELTFIAEKSWEVRYATVYLHKGDYVDSVKLTQPEAPWVHTQIDLWPCSWTFPASGGTVEATTKGTVCQIKDIVITKKEGDGTKGYRLSDDGAVWQASKAMYEWVTVEINGNEIKITVDSNVTGMCREFKIELMRNKVIDGKTCLQTDNFYGMQNSETTKCFMQNIQ